MGYLIGEILRKLAAHRGREATRRLSLVLSVGCLAYAAGWLLVSGPKVEQWVVVAIAVIPGVPALLYRRGRARVQQRRH